MPIVGSDSAIDTSDFASVLASLGSGTTSATAKESGTVDNPNVYLGRKNVYAAPGAARAAGVPNYQYTNPKNSTIDDVQDYDTASASIYSWTQQEQQQLAKRLYNAGLLDDPSDINKLASLWSEAVYQAGMMYTQSKGQTRLTPLQYLDSRINYAITGGLGVNAAPKTTTNTSTQVVLPDRSDAEASVSTLFQESLGRDPTDSEMDRYVSMMMSKYKANPATTTTKTTTDSSGNSTSKSTTSGQYNPAQDLQNAAQDDEEWGAYQAATKYFNATMSALAAPANLT